jgi:hypothetical protein
MRYFAKIADGLDVAPALVQLDAHPGLWGQKPDRTAIPDSPHRQTTDIWLRFRPEHELTSREKYGEPHFAAFWPAWYALPGLHPIVFDIMARMQAVYLGGILLTRIPAGAEVLPHIDTGWHPTFNNTKAYVILKANPDCLNHCLDETVVMQPREAWLFNNTVIHSVQNRGDDERIAMVITMRVEP